jgi:L-fuconolactonase
MSGHQGESKTVADHVDAHHHLWQYRPQSYGWIDERMTVLRRDYLAEELERELCSEGLAGSVAVQARPSLVETNWLLSVAAGSKRIGGVVGWAPIASAKFPAVLERLRGRKKLKGLRHGIQDEPDEAYILRRDFNRGIARLKGSGLVYEILIHERHLPAAIEFVDRHPNQMFVLDHLAKPRIREATMEPWQSQITNLARRENIYCKVSGMTTEANWSDWTSADLRPYFDVALDVFGPRRLIAGSDWPVCLLATSYSRWWQTLRDFVAVLSTDEQDRILGTNAIQVYQLNDSLRPVRREEKTSEGSRYQKTR